MITAPSQPPLFNLQKAGAGKTDHKRYPPASADNAAAELAKTFSTPLQSSRRDVPRG
ncbi:hypothetical protein KCP77_22895 [Salmonella enterica subsp. enterica]|nr:hypothetical protein KCP77_22895 [Salmonella enterica subsp. enterica]